MAKKSYPKPKSAPPKMSSRMTPNGGAGNVVLKPQKKPGK